MAVQEASARPAWSTTLILTDESADHRGLEDLMIDFARAFRLQKHLLMGIRSKPVLHQV